MALYLGPEFPPTWSGYPPRMSEEDYQIWQRWWPTVQQFALRMWFDVGLGTGRPIPPGTSPELTFMWERNTQKRADVIIETTTAIWLVELRHAASLNAIGRLEGYFDLLEADNLWRKTIAAFLVTDREDRDVRASATKRDINYVVV